MITDPKEYLKMLSIIQSANPPEIALLLPSTEGTLNIDLNTRKIESPEYLSVTTDHRAEIVYFKVARYFENVDLAEMNCIVQFINAAGDSGLFVVPFYDTSVCQDTQEMVFPWLIEGAATAAAGNVTFSVQFFKVSENGGKYIYNLNTLTSQAKVLQGNGFDKGAVGTKMGDNLTKILDELTEGEKVDFTYPSDNVATAYELLVNKMNEIKQSEAMNLYWIDFF